MDYLGTFIYEDDILKYMLTEEGRVMVNTNGTYSYQYFLKDHLGNTRITFKTDGEVIQEDAYYPFGMNMAGLSYQNGINSTNQYLYNGKELQEDFGLGWYDYGFRYYDAGLARFISCDLLNETYPSHGTYNYAANNPLRFIDIKGLNPDDVIKTATSYLGTWYEYGGKNPNINFVSHTIDSRDGKSVGKIMFASIYLAQMVNSFQPSYVLKPSDVYSFFNLNIPLGNSMGIDCSGLSKLAFNSDPDKLMSDLPDGARYQMKKFIDAEKVGTGILHSDFSKLIKGDLVFNTKVNEDGERYATHVMISTGESNINNSGEIEFNVIEAGRTGTQAGSSKKTVNQNYRIGHTKRKDNNKKSNPWTFKRTMYGSFINYK